MRVCAGLYVYDNVVKKFMFAVPSPDEFLCYFSEHWLMQLSINCAKFFIVNSQCMHRIGLISEHNSQCFLIACRSSSSSAHRRQRLLYSADNRKFC